MHVCLMTTATTFTINKSLFMKIAKAYLNDNELPVKKEEKNLRVVVVWSDGRPFVQSVVHFQW